jgi:ribosomal protein S18 acetylase RimI-like enzyme
MASIESDMRGMGRMTGTITATADNIGSMVAAWKLMVGRIPGFRIADAERVAVMIANTPKAFMNFIVLDRPCENEPTLRAALAVAHGHAAACRYPTMIVLCPEWLPSDWQDIVAGEGLVFFSNMTGMAADILLPPQRPLPAIDYRLATDVATATDLAMINAHAYGMDEAQAAAMCTPDLYQAGSFGVVGYVGGRAVSAAATHIVGDFIYVTFVATEPDCHGRGYADAVMRHAISLAQAGGTRSIWLHATDMGQPVYRAMGFETGAATPTYMFTDLAGF